MNAFYKQFAKPSGFAGWLAGKIMSFRTSNRLRNSWTVEQLRIEDGNSILEIGFGPGFAIQTIAQKFPNCKIVGVDHSDVMVHMAAKNNRASMHRGQVRLIQGDVAALKMTESFDRIFTLNCHMFWPDLDQVLNRLTGVLKSDGRLAITYQPRGPKASDEKSIHEAEVLAAAMAKAGLVEIQTSRLELNPYVHCVIGRKS